MVSELVVACVIAQVWKKEVEILPVGSVENEDCPINQQRWVELKKHLGSSFDLEMLAQLVACREPFAVDAHLLVSLDFVGILAFFALPALGYDAGRLVDSALEKYWLLRHLPCAWLLLFQEIVPCLLNQY